VFSVWWELISSVYLLSWSSGIESLLVFSSASAYLERNYILISVWFVSVPAIDCWIVLDTYRSPILLSCGTNQSLAAVGWVGVTQQSAERRSAPICSKVTAGSCHGNAEHSDQPVPSENQRAAKLRIKHSWHFINKDFYLMLSWSFVVTVWGDPSLLTWLPFKYKES
jgi:hypothetical protein